MVKTAELGRWKPLLCTAQRGVEAHEALLQANVLLEQRLSPELELGRRPHAPAHGRAPHQAVEPPHASWMNDDDQRTAQLQPSPSRRGVSERVLTGVEAARGSIEVDARVIVLRKA